MRAEGRQAAAPTRVAVVDDDDVNRRGMTSLLSEHRCVEVVASFGHAEALIGAGLWDNVDVLLVDAADERSRGDQFLGVAVVDEVRRRRSAQQTTIVVVTGHFFDDAVRRRMREARADFFYHRSEVGDAHALLEAVLRPSAHRYVPGPSDPEAVFSHGVTDHTRVNRAVEFAARVGLAADEQRSRRAWQGIRREFNRHAQLNPVTLDGRPPDRRQIMPSRPQIVRFLLWATQTKTPGPPGH